jgi:hypothetical protein
LQGYNIRSFELNNASPDAECRRAKKNCKKIIIKFACKKILLPLRRFKPDNLSSNIFKKQSDMAKKRFIWKVFLRLNLLTKDNENDYVADVSTMGDTVRNEDVVSAIIEEGSEISFQTLLSVLNRSDAIKRRFLQLSRSVQDGLGHYKPQILGPWDGATAKFDDTVNAVSLEMIPSPEMHEALKEVGVEVIGVKDGGAYIGRVINAETGEADGAIVPGEDVIIEGEKIRVAPDNSESLGVFFTNTETGVATKVVKRLVKNDPKTVIARVPDLSTGKYSLSIVTQFSNSKVALKAPRTIVYEHPLSVK